MITENLSVLKIHNLTQAQYDRELAAGNIDKNALYLVPEDEIDLSDYATVEELNQKSDIDHTHSEYISSAGLEILMQDKADVIHIHAIEDIADLQSTLDEKADKTQIPTKVSQLTNDSGFLTSIPSEYVTDSELDNKGYLTDIPSEYVTDTELDTFSDTFGGTVEITAGNPEKENTVVTLNPNGNEINVYTVDEIDAMVNGLEEDVVDIKSQIIQQTPLFANSIEECVDTTKVYVLPDGYIYGYMATEVNQIINQFNPSTAVLNARCNSSGQVKSLDGYVLTDYIDIDLVNPYIVNITGVTLVNTGSYAYYAHITFFDENETFLGINELSNGYQFTSFTSGNYSLDLYAIANEKGYTSAKKVRITLNISGGTAIDESAVSDLFIEFVPKNQAYTNLAKTFESGRLNSSGVIVAADGATACADYIPFTHGTVVRIKGFGALTDYNSAQYDADKVVLNTSKANAASMYLEYQYDGATGIVTLTSVNVASFFLRVSGILSGTTDDVIITVNEEIKGETVTRDAWTNTGHAFIPADYEDRIVALEDDVVELKNKVESLNGGVSHETVVIPSYWESMVTEKTETVKAIQENGGKNCISFAWVADTHIPDNDGGRTTDIGKVMAKMLDNCEIPFTMLSGDINTRASYDTEAGLISCQDQMPVHLAPLWGTDRLLMALGNHDGCWGDSSGYYRKQFSPERMWQTFFRGQALDFRRVFSDDGLYFYVDNIPQKTRFIVLNSHYGGEYAEDANGWAVNNRFSTSCYGQEQLDWLADVALDMPDGYGAIITAHVPPNITYTVDKAQFIGIVNAYNNRTTYSGSYAGIAGWTSNSVSVDFTQAKGEIIAMFAGHVHGDSIDTTTLACPLLTILSAGASANESYAETAPTRTKGTDTETNFDVVTIDRKERKIYCTRIGAGIDREVDY